MPRSVGFRYTCRGLFERHKLLFSFHMCAKILESSGKLNMDEYDFFLRGGIVSTTACWRHSLHYWAKDLQLSALFL